MFRTVVGGADGLVRAYYGIAEFTNDPRCLFRLAFDRARNVVVLPNGLQIDRGEVIGTLHLWNEHLPRYPENGPDLAWASDMHRRIRHSLGLLAENLKRDPAWREVRAIRADTNWSSHLGSGQIRRVFKRYGFELIEHERTILQPFHTLGASLQAWVLTRAFNPSALPRQPLLRSRHELWITRSVLMSRYGRR